jgi:hypothetical protein
MKIIEWIIYLIGVLFLGEFIHELIHFSRCGGPYLVGIYYTGQQTLFSSTWCPKPDIEWLPRLVEGGVLLVGVGVKIRNNGVIIWANENRQTN